MKLKKLSKIKNILHHKPTYDEFIEIYNFKFPVKTSDKMMKKIYRFCDGEIVDGLNRRHYKPEKEDDMQCICTILNAQIHQLNKLQERNNRQKETITKQQEQIDNYINIKAKLDAKITEYETKSKEYELSACGCGSKHNWIKKTALKQFKEELFGKDVKE